MLRDESMANQILDIIDTLLEAADYLYQSAVSKKYQQVEVVASDMINTLQTILPITEQIKTRVPFISGPLSCENLIHSIEGILILVKTRSDRLLSKVEFELIPILQDFYYDLYFFTSIYGDKDKEFKHYKDEFISMIGNRYINEGLISGNYKYDLSISVLAYNKLDYTKKCVESILRYTPNALNYELILINNGSEDETQQYFESLSPTKIFSLKKNSLNIVTGSVSRIYEGRYQLTISNDVIVTENYLDNLIKCIESDPSIAMVVPTTPNISNLQSIPAHYTSLEEMHEFSRENNISDFKRWEERTRLCNPLTFCRSDILFSSSGVSSFDKYFVYGEFGDDALALRLRRAGYKMILAKDCYCYHFGSVTLGEAQAKENTLEKSRKLFIDRHGVDAWSTGFCYDPYLVEAFELKKNGHVNILGINSGFGSNPLKVKTLHKEVGNLAVDLFFVTDDERYVPDLKVYALDAVDAAGDIFKAYQDTQFDYILLESNVQAVLKSPKDIAKLTNKLKKDGVLAICGSNNAELKLLERLDPVKKIEGHNCYWFLWTA